MHRRLALVALWAAFAAASVGVGFAAAGLVGDPFTDPRSAEVSTAARGRLTSAPVGPPSPTAPTSTRPSPDRTPTATAGPRTTDGGTPPPVRTPGSIRRTITTRAGLVSGTCRGGLVSLSASPTVGWSIDEISQGRREEGQVKFRGTTDREGGQVEVQARCRGDGPVFEVDDREASGSRDGSGD